jgi:hypothetical protein
MVIETGKSIAEVARDLFSRAGMVAVAVVVVAAGAVTAPATADHSNSPRPGPGCDPTRPAVAHRAGGVPIAMDARTAITPIPCAVEVGPTTETANIGITARGTVFYAPWVASTTLPVSPDHPSMIARSRDDGASWTTVTATSPLPQLSRSVDARGPQDQPRVVRDHWLRPDQVR